VIAPKVASPDIHTCYPS